MQASTSRTAAAAVAIVGWAGLTVQFSATQAASGSAAEAIWILLRFFTILTNLLVAIVLTLIALGRRVSPALVGGVTLAILLVGIIYISLLRGLYQLQGAALLADRLLHYAMPALTVVFWLVFAPKGGLRWRDPWLWCLYPLVYFAYALARGASDDFYPYPFMDVGKIGVAQTAVNAVAIAAAFVIAGWGMVWLDARLLGRRDRASKAPR